jgi:hypothetical protein
MQDAGFSSEPGRVFDTRRGYWIFHLTESFQAHYGSGLESASNSNEYKVSSCLPVRKADNLFYLQKCGSLDV